MKRSCLSFFFFFSFLSLFATPQDTPFWNVLLELGRGHPSPKKAAFEVIEEFLHYTKAALYSPHYTEEAKAYADLFQAQMKTFDIEEMYQALPFYDKQSLWRGSHHLEQYKQGKIHISLGDPEIQKWLRLPKKEYYAPWRELRHFGESDQRFYVAPSRTTPFGKCYESYYFERMGLGNLHFKGILHGLVKLLAYLERGVREVPPGFEAPEEIQRNFSTLSQGEKYLIWRFSQDMPSLYRKVTRYVRVHSISTPLEWKGKPYCRFNLKLSLHWKNLEKDFPHFARYLKRIQGFLELKSRMYDAKGRFVGFLFFSTTNFTFHFSYCMHQGRFLPTLSGWRPANFKGFSPLDYGVQRHTFRNDLKIQVNGIQVLLRNWVLKETYIHTPEEATLLLESTTPPIVQRISGRAYGIVPVWLIDLLIPSNVEELLNQFFTVLTKGRKGKGWYMRFHAATKGHHRIEMATGSEILSNGILRLAFQILSELLTPDAKAQQDITRFGKAFWHAFVADYFRYRYGEEEE